jgi:hypothetical protein
MYFIFGRINDDEFCRESPLSAKCDEEAAIRTWQARRQLKSERQTD